MTTSETTSETTSKATSERARNQFSSPATPYEKVACPNCRSDASAFKTVFDNDGFNWQITCFECGQVTATSPDGPVLRQLRHKCRVRYRLG